MMTAAELKWYSDLKAELGRYGVPIDDTSKLAPIINGISQYVYEVDKVLQAFSDVDSLAAQHKLYYGLVQELENKVNSFKQQCWLLEQMANSHNQSISIYKELEVMGFGLKQLRLLYHTKNEIADANNIRPDQAQHKSYKDIEEQYDNKLGFEPKVNELRFEVRKLGQDISRLRSELLSMPLVGHAIIGLIRSGLKEHHIIKLAGMFEGYRRSRRGCDIDTQVLIAELEKYVSIREAVQKSKQELDNLNKRVASLRARKEALEKDMSTTLSTSRYSRQAVDFLQGTVASLRNDMAGLVSIIGYIAMHLLMLRSEEERIRKFDGLDEFVPLIRSH
jgi:myosin heavy subunit